LIIVHFQLSIIHFQLSINLNYFDFFEIPISFTVDTATLKRKFLKNSKQYHPDFHSLSNEATQAKVLELSTINNEAYKTLNDFDKRMEYILRIKGMLAEEGSTKLPQDFLMEMMEINEAIMELEFDFEEANFQAIKKSVDDFEKNIFAEVQNSIENWTETAENDEILKKVKIFYLKKKYLLRILENLSKFAAA
jgi:molecular chaperone HscB